MAAECMCQNVAQDFLSNDACSCTSLNRSGLGCDAPELGIVTALCTAATAGETPGINPNFTGCATGPDEACSAGFGENRGICAVRFGGNAVF